MPQTNLDGYFVFEWNKGILTSYSGPFTKESMNEYISRRPAGTYQIIKAQHCYEVRIKTDVRDEAWEELQ